MNIEYDKPLAPQFEAYCKAHPGETALELVDLSDKTDQQITDLFQAIPEVFTSLILKGNKLGSLPTDRIVTILKALPPQLTSLDLSVNDLGTKSAAELLTIFQTLKKTVVSLDFGANFEHGITEDALIQLLTTMSELKSLRLHDYIISIKLAKLLPALPKTLTSLDLSANFFQNLSAEELVEDFKALPPLVTLLNLSRIYLNKKSAEDLVKIFKGIPLKVNVLDISLNGFDNTTLQNLVTALKELPEHVKTLHLGNSQFTAQFNNKFGSTADLATLFKAMPTHLTALDLSGLALQKHSAEELATTFALLPENLTTLDLSHNKFTSKPSELISLLNALPPNINSLKLNGAIWNMTADNLVKVFNAVPGRITKIDIDNPLDETTKEAVTKALATKSLHLFLSGVDLNPGAAAFTPPPPTATPVSPGLLLAFMSHTAIKVVASALIVASLAVLLCAGFGVAGLTLGLGLGLTMAATTTVGAALLAGSFFASHKMAQLNPAPVETPAP